MLRQFIKWLINWLNATSAQPLARSYLFLRTGIGIIGVALPIVLVIGNITLERHLGILDSMSAYYQSVMRDVFVGSLWAIGIFLICYQYDHLDDLVSTVAGFCAIGLSLVNACVILRRNNFDPLLIFSPRVTTYRVLRSVCSATRAHQRCAPKRTRGIPQSHLRALVSSAKPTTGVQVERAFRPRCLDSLTPGAHRAGPLHPRGAVVCFCPTPALMRQGEIAPTPMWLAPAYF